MSRDVSNSDDFIDSRDVIARIEELEKEREEEREPLQEAVANADANLAAARLAAGEGNGTLEVAAANDHLLEAQNALELFDEFEGEELENLREFADEAEGYAVDWLHGATLIRDSHFEEYARDFADDIGAVNKDAHWPNSCIDWKRAAEELQMDYTSVDFDGTTYWVR